MAQNFERFDMGSIDLPKLMLDDGIPLTRRGRRWISHACPNCGEGSKSSNRFNVYFTGDRWRYHCFACGLEPGDAADYIVIRDGVTIGEAMRLLRGDAIPVSKQDFRGAANKDVETRRIAVREVCSLIKANAKEDASPYLESRGIARKTVQLAHRSGQLFLLPARPILARAWLMKHVGSKLLLDSGILKPSSTWPAMAYRPILAIDPSGGSVECRVVTKTYTGSKTIRYGPMKWPWYMARGTKKVSSVLVVEGMVDLLSAWQGVPEVDAVMGSPGTDGWSIRWFKAFHAKNPGAKVIIGFDKDAAGNSCGKKLGEALDECGIENDFMLPPRGNDWNEWLTSL